MAHLFMLPVMLIAFYFGLLRYKSISPLYIEAPTSKSYDRIDLWGNDIVTLNVDKNGNAFLSFDDTIERQKIFTRFAANNFFDTSKVSQYADLLLFKDTSTILHSHLSQVLSYLHQSKPRHKLLINADKNLRYEIVRRLFDAICNCNEIKGWYKIAVVVNTQR